MCQVGNFVKIMLFQRYTLQMLESTQFAALESGHLRRSTIVLHILAVWVVRRADAEVELRNLDHSHHEILPSEYTRLSSGCRAEIASASSPSPRAQEKFFLHC